MAIEDADYQQFPYVFATLPGYGTDMTTALRKAVRATLSHLVGQPLNYLEIGVWEGRSGCWMLDNVLTHPDSRYTGIDNWTSLPQVPIFARTHLGYHGSKALLIEGDSKKLVPQLRGMFDIGFVDGGHDFETCYADLCNVWDKLKPGGTMIADDYAFGPNLPDVPVAVDRFYAERDDAELIFKEVAVVFRKSLHSK
ncbi:class I SAM-dependent methyltransferase [Candidatus Pacearchaeota archaeon]|jgi:predicted O-methyltransferase YrrM|nr:class I SAM-dependent methyltransferase [Candidatus Pacearchaeota archaeon]